MAHPSQLGLQDAASPVIEELLHFHDHALMIVLLISTLVLYIIVSMVSTKLTNKYILDSQEIEIVWTILPAVILILIALPSLRILYLIDEINDPHLTIKAMGHQWYWSRIYRLWRSRIWFLHGPHPRPSTGTVPTPRDRPPNSSTNRVPDPSSRISWRCIALLSGPCLRGKNRRRSRALKPNSFHCLPPWCILRTMFWNLRGKPQLHANRRGSRTSCTLRKLILTYTWRRLTKMLNWAWASAF